MTSHPAFTDIRALGRPNHVLYDVNNLARTRISIGT